MYWNGLDCCYAFIFLTVGSIINASAFTTYMLVYFLLGTDYGAMIISNSYSYIISSAGCHCIVGDLPDLLKTETT